MNNYGQYAENSFVQSDMALVSFVKQTYQLFAGSLLAATIGAYIGISALGGVVAQYYIGFVILEFALLLDCFYQSKTRHQSFDAFCFYFCKWFDINSNP